MVEKTILLPAFLYWILFLYFSQRCHQIKWSCRATFGRERGNQVDFFPPKPPRATYSQSEPTSVSTVGETIFFWPDLIFERIGSFFSAERVKNEHNVKQTPNGGGGNFVTFNIEKAYLL